MNLKIFLILVSIILLGGVLRFYHLTSIPPQLNIDEVSIGFNAYSILKTGRDEYGKFLPISFESVGDYKPPVLVYLMVPSIAVFGLNEFGVRFPNAFLSTISIVLFYFLFLKISKNKWIGLLAAFLVAISLWNIYFSRYAVESLVAMILFSAGLYLLLVLTEKPRNIFAIISAILFSLSIYAYHAERLFVPLFLLLFLILRRKSLIKIWRKCLLFLVLLSLLTLPLYSSMLFGNNAVRAKQTYIGNDIEFTRPVDVVPDVYYLSNPFLKIIANRNVLLFFYWLRKYLNYFEPSFLLNSGLNLTTSGFLGVGVIYLFELPFLVYGGYLLIKKRLKNWDVVLTWILLGILPASLTQNEQHPLRSLIILPAVLLITSAGIYFCYKNVVSVSSKLTKYFVYLISTGLFVWSMVHGLMAYFLYFPIQREEDFMGGTKEAVLYVLDNQDKYKQIVFDPKRGVVAPYIVSIPHMYLLFYSQYDPAKYQKLYKISNNDSFSFDKYTIRNIDWRVDREAEDVLFVGSPWSFPNKEILGGKLLKIIYLASGDPAFYIVAN